MGSMTPDEYTPRMRALDRVARSISEHQAVQREGRSFSTCKNRLCNEPVFVNMQARYEHQAIVLVNDLQRELDLTLGDARDDAKAEGRELTAEDEAAIRSDFMVLAPAPEPASGLAAVLALHAPVRRYQGCFLDKLTFPTAERALLQNRRDPMRGFESIVLTGVGDVPFVEVCGECSRVENSFEQHGDGYPDDHDDEQDGTELSTKASAWPCATYTAVAI